MVRLGLVVACALAVCVLTAAEFRRNERMRWWAKSAASGCFLALAGVGLASRQEVSAVAVALMVGLGLGAVGDVALLGRGRRWFRVGALAFLLGNVAYVVALARFASPARWLDWTSVAPVIVTSVVLRSMWQAFGRERLLVAAYSVPLTLLAVGALALATAGRQPALAGAGLAFYVSDLFVARSRFASTSVPVQAIGRAIYYTAQVIFAFAVGDV